MFIGLFVFFLAMLIMGLPIFISMIIPSLIALFYHFVNLDMTVSIQRMVGGVDTFSLLAIPFFMFAADLMSKGNIGKKLVNLTNKLVGHYTGGLAIATVVTCTLFGAISGAGPAAIVAVGTILYPALISNGYDKSFALGVIVSSSTLAMLIPPGIAMILYGVSSSTSIGALFAAGLSIGIILAFFFSVYVFIVSKIRKYPRQPKSSVREILVAFKDAIFAIGLPVIMLGGIYGGFMTPTEAAAVGVVYVLIVEMLIYKQLSPKDVYEIAISSGSMVAMIFVLIAAGSLLSWLMTAAQIPQTLVRLLDGAPNILVLLLINVIFLIAGMFLDPNSAIIILTPLVYPIAINAGVVPIHLGLLIVLNAAIGMLTPPFGLNIFVASGTFKVPYEEIIPGLIPFIAIGIGTLLLITFVPEIVLWLPNLVK